jgi:hypothetical protein
VTTVAWSWDDLRIIADIVAGSLLAGALRLIVLKAFLEPVAAFVGQQAYNRADRALGDRLPNLPTAEP